MFLKFDLSGNPEWSKQYEGPNPSMFSKLIVDEDSVIIYGSETPTTDLDFNSGSVYLPDYSNYWAEYFDGPVSGPIADFSGTPTSGTTPLTVGFADLSVSGTDPITSWNWDFGDGNTSSQQNPSHLYTEGGTYTITLIVSDGILSDVEEKVGYIVVAQAVPPTAEFSADPNSGTAPQSISFTDLSVAGTNSIMSWDWDFGDGGNSSSQNPWHTYDTPGDYTVSLSVSDGSLSDTITKQEYIVITPADPPSAEFSADPQNGTAPVSVEFTDLSVAGSNNITSWSWDFGDGGSSSSQNPWHTYNESGSYTVSLTVSDESISDTETKVDYITITVAPPVADFTSDITMLEEGGSVSFIDMSTGGQPSQWYWAFEGGNPATSTEQNMTVTYDTEGTYNVSITVTNDAGSDTKLVEEYITVSMEPYLALNPTSVIVEANSGNTGFNISSNNSWAIATSDPLVIASPSSGSGNASISVNYPAINTIAGTIYTVTVTSGSGIVEVFTITQNGVSAFIILTPGQANVPSSAGQLTFNVDCPSDLIWDATGLAGWLSASPLSGIGMGIVTLTYEANPNQSSRSDEFFVSGNEATSIFQITQVGAGAPLVAYATSSVEVINVGQEFQLFGSATGGADSYSYEWTGTGGFSSFEQNPFVSPEEVGIHTYTLIVSDGENTATDQLVVSVFGEPTISLWSNFQAASVGQVVSFETTIVFDVSDPRTIVDILIEFGDGASALGYGNPFSCSHAYNESNSFDIEINGTLSDGSIIQKTFLGFIDITVGGAIIEESVMIIFPNPTTGKLFIEAGKSVEKLSIINVNGVKVFQEKNPEDHHQLDLSVLPSGLYFIRILSEGKYTTHKIVIN